MLAPKSLGTEALIPACWNKQASRIPQADQDVVKVQGFKLEIPPVSPLTPL